MEPRDVIFWVYLNNPYCFVHKIFGSNGQGTGMVFAVFMRVVFGRSRLGLGPDRDQRLGQIRL
jgi:hypothetical protein